MKKRFYDYQRKTLVPTKEHPFDAGYDLALPEKLIIRPFETKVIDLQVKVNLSENQCGVVCLRSSIAKLGLVAANSPVDYGYSGNIHLIVTNCSGNTYEFKQFDKICQLVIYYIPVEDDGDFYGKEPRK